MKKLLLIEDVVSKINNGEFLILAADENLLNQLPKGNWIGGTIPYFMDEDGGIFTKNEIFVDDIPDFVKNVKIKFYDEKELPSITSDAYQNGYTVLIIPGFSELHISFAEKSNQYRDIFLNPLVGWVAGIDLADLGRVKPKVYNGILGESSTTKSTVMHVELPDNKIPTLDIVNLFEQGDGDTITFGESGFKVKDCFINGEKKNFAEYLHDSKIDSRLPLVADYYGVMINTSFSKIDIHSKHVNFYAPVFKDVEYKIAKPIKNYVSTFIQQVSRLNINPVFSCNCILNYLYSELEGKKTANITGPMTFGEIAYQLLNQTMVYLNIEDI